MNEQNTLNYTNYLAREHDGLSMRRACDSIYQAMKDGFKEFKEWRENNPESHPQYTPPALYINLVKDGTGFSYDFFIDEDGNDTGTCMFSNLYAIFGKKIKASLSMFEKACDEAFMAYEEEWALKGLDF